MRITKCHAENFGKLQNFDFTPDGGISVIDESNGFGKTTFSYFVKAMLYGLSPKKTLSLAENERKRFAPWQGGVFGGYIEFTAGGRSFRIERVFGSKESADVCRVYDLDRGRETDELLPSPGLSLLGVDADTFERTCFFSDRKLTPQGSGAVVGRLVSLIENYNYSAADDTTDAAIALLRDRRREIKPLRGGGGELGEVSAKLNECRSEHAKCREAAKKREAVMAAVALGDEAIADLNERAAELEKARRACRDSLASESKRHLLSELEKKVEDSGRRVADGRKFFASEAPPAKDLTDGLASVIADRRAKCAVLARRTAELSALESELECAPLLKNALEISTEDIERGESAARKYSESSALLDRAKSSLGAVESSRASLALSYPNGFPSEEELSEASAASETKKRAELLCSEARANAERQAIRKAEEAAREAERREEASRKSARSRRLTAAATLTVAIGLAVASVILGVASVPGIVLIACAVIGGAAATVLLVRAGAREDNAVPHISTQDDGTDAAREAELIRAIEASEEILREFSVKYLPSSKCLGDEIFYRLRSAKERAEALDAEISDQTNSLTELDRARCQAKAELISCLNRARIEIREPIDTRAILNTYSELRTRRSQAEDLTGRIGICRCELDETERIVAELDRALIDAFAAFPGIASLADCERDALSARLDSSLALLTRRAWEYDLAIDEQRAASEEISRFIKENPELATDSQFKSADEIREAEASADAALAQINEEKERRAGRRAELLAECSGYEAIEDRAPALLGEERALSEECTRLAHIAELYDCTMKYLAEAKENIAEKYMTELRENFDGYTAIASPDRALSVNNQLELSYDAYGARRSDETMSRGERAIAELCIRLATADTVYTAEAPPLIIDDTFAELDSQNLARAHELIKNASERYQIIYLTCRGERVPI